MARPSFKPTPAQRRKVAIAAGAGISHEEIAIGMGITRPTLSKHFEVELSTGAHQKRLEVVQAMFAAAKRGSVAAAKTYLALDPKVAAPPLHLPATEGKPAAVGKKAQAQLDAVTAAAGSDWSELLGAQPPVQ